MKLRAAVPVLLAALLAPVALEAQVQGNLPKVLTLPASTRAMALGNAYVLTERHADVLFYQPALLSRASGFGLDVQRWSAEASSTTASAAMAWLGGGVGIGLQTLQYSAPSIAVPGGQDHIFQAGPIPVSERVATLGYGRTLKGIALGAAGKLVDQRVSSARNTLLLVDLGVAHEVGPFMVGLTAKDLGPQAFDTDGNGEEESAEARPARFVLGAGAYGQEVGIFDLGVAAQVSYSSDETLVGGGLEIGYWPITGRTFVARVGAQKVPDGSEASPVTFGFSYWGDDLVLEWAYRDFGDVGEGTHRFGVRWR
ncbi:MAG TPA: hypothetical protein VLA36_14685 [Longimicrobiales bacterium]|nr:hypothetical protein [Longimicrobiales bacterium]